MKFSLVKYSLVILTILIKSLHSLKTGARTFIRNRNLFEFLSLTDSKASSGNSTSANSNSTSTNSTPIKSLSGNNINSSYIVDFKDPTMGINGWMSIESVEFRDTTNFPIIKLHNGEEQSISTDPQMIYQRVNLAFSKGTSANGFPEDPSLFWFQARGGYIYYTSTKEDINILQSIFVKELKQNSKRVRPRNAGNKTVEMIQPCFDIIDSSSSSYTICHDQEEEALKWICSFQLYLEEFNMDKRCFEKYGPAQFKSPPQIVVTNITQPMIIIPTVGPICNENWDYKTHGEDWECICSEGQNQSPIDLPPKEKATPSPIKPIFNYEIKDKDDNTETTIDGINTNGIQLRYHHECIKILSAFLGKVVKLDGSLYAAEEINFHTPSEHLINGERFDMEMQIVHYGRTKGDIANQVILSFLFKKTPGKYNKFIDSLDFYSLPNPIDTTRDLYSNLYIPNVLYDSDEDAIPVMKPFSFYTYEGSLTHPPCTERTTLYVAADAVPLSSTAISLFKEALRKPDMMDNKGNYILNMDPAPENYRNTQPLNNREVFVYDTLKYDCPEFVKKPQEAKPIGHYEKHQKEITQYVFVNGDQPSGIPGAFLVSEAEAKGQFPPVTQDDLNTST